MKTIKTLSVLIFLFMVGCGGETNAPSPAESSEPAPVAPAEPAAADNDALIAEGKTLFEGTAICFTCHGPDAKGTPLAPDLTDAEWLNIEAPADMEKISAVIRNGVTEPKSFPAPMPPMANLTDDQVEAVAAYVLSLVN